MRSSSYRAPTSPSTRILLYGRCNGKGCGCRFFCAFLGRQPQDMATLPKGDFMVRHGIKARCPQVPRSKGPCEAQWSCPTTCHGLGSTGVHGTSRTPTTVAEALLVAPGEEKASKHSLRDESILLIPERSPRIHRDLPGQRVTSF